MAGKPSLRVDYYMTFSDWNDDKVLLLDRVNSLTITQVLNGVDTFTIDAGANTKVRTLKLDSLLRVYRRVQGLKMPWDLCFAGLYRGRGFAEDSAGKITRTIQGVGLNHFLARTQIAYLGGLVMSDKSCPSETAMKEYVLENCGTSATLANLRQADGVLPRFLVDPDGAQGLKWEGSKTGEALLDTLQGISGYATMDFAVVLDPEIAPSNFVFKTYPKQLGLDRTTYGLNTHTGLNAYGNYPVVFSELRENVQSVEYTMDRKSEANRIFVLGDGDGATRTWITREAATKYDSPWNRCEISRPQGGFQYQMNDAGDELLYENKAKESFGYTVLQQTSCFYRKHYFLGDRCGVEADGEKGDQRITQIDTTWKDSKEVIAITFAEFKR